DSGRPPNFSETSELLPPFGSAVSAFWPSRSTLLDPSALASSIGRRTLSPLRIGFLWPASRLGSAADPDLAAAVRPNAYRAQSVRWGRPAVSHPELVSQAPPASAG